MGTSGIGIRVWDGTQDINGRPIKPGRPVAPPPEDMGPRGAVDRKKIKAGRKVAARNRRKR